MLAHIKRKWDFKKRGVVVWTPCNVYNTAKIGDRVSIGMFSEIGSDVTIGDDTRIGMGVFLPSGVVIGKNCFIGPKVCMVHANDMQRPPFQDDHKSKWTSVVVEDDALIGANAMILGGVTIHKGAVIGMGSVVTKDVGPYEVWAGNPARLIKSKEDSNV